MECIACKKPATLVCGSCSGSPILEGDSPIANYCNSVCQETHWTHHEPTCRRRQDRKALCMIGEMAQRLFYIHRELTWKSLAIVQVDKVGNNLIIRERTTNDATTTSPKKYRFFPFHLVSTKEDKNAILVFKACVEGVMWTMEFVDGMLEGIVTTSTHFVYKTKNDRLRTRCYPLSTSLLEIVNNMDYISHEIIKVTLRSGEVFAVDITGAQYGYHEPVTPWTKYEQERIFCAISEVDLYPSSKLLQIDDYSAHELNHIYKLAEGLKPHVFMTALAVMKWHILGWQRHENMSLKKWWTLPEETLRMKLNDLIHFIEWSFHSPVETL